MVHLWHDWDFDGAVNCNCDHSFFTMLCFIEGQWISGKSLRKWKALTTGNFKKYNMAGKFGGEFDSIVSLASSPGPFPPSRGLYTLFEHVQNIFHKNLCALPCPYAEDYTNQEYRAFFEIHSSDDLTYRTLLGFFSDVAVSFWKVSNPFTKKGRW